MKPSAIIHKNGGVNEAIVNTGKERIHVDMSNLHQHEQLTIIRNLWDWKKKGYVGNPLI